MMERILAEVSFTASDRSGERIEIDAAFIEKNIGDLARLRGSSQELRPRVLR
ncbi:MAG TPA: hypothetical protein VHT02_03820 [Methylocella sp.]|nr:hypothetical protein [Methylocella sp.]